MSRRASSLLALLVVGILLLTAAPSAMAADGIGLLGRVDDLEITIACFVVILFFPVMITVLSLIQGRLEARKERRRYDLQRLG